jgi:hypothetical protein
MPATARRRFGAGLLASGTMLAATSTLHGQGVIDLNLKPLRAADERPEMVKSAAPILSILGGMSWIWGGSFLPRQGLHQPKVSCGHRCPASGWRSVRCPPRERSSSAAASAG